MGKPRSRGSRQLDRRSLVRQGAIAALSVPVVGSALATSGARGARAAQDGSGEPIVLGIVTALTTPFALAGIHVRNGSELAAEEINAAGGILGRPIEFVIEDTANSNTTAVNAFNRVAAANPYAILGSIYGTQNLALNPLIERQRIPYFYSSGTIAVSEQGNEWLFGLSPSDAVQARATARWVAGEMGKQRIGIQYVNNEYGQGALEVLRQTLVDEFSLEPVSVETHAAEDTDMSAQLLKHQDADVDVIIVWGHPGDVVVIAKQAVQYDLPRPFVGPSAPLLPSTLALLEGPETEWLGPVVAWVSDNPDEEMAAFRERYAEMFEEPIDFFDAIYYDAVYMLKAALEVVLPEAGDDLQAIRDGIRDQLAGMSYEGLDTMYEFDDKGRGPHAVTLVQVVDEGARFESLGVVRGD
jgi:branched-chain amino acid transport system substrate-binding protein